jgi:Flp pilus assembly protein TadG
MRDRQRQRGQASVELVAAVPVLLAVLVALLQLTVVGCSLWSAAAAARAGARAAFVDGDPRAAALSAIPEALDPDASVRAAGGTVDVTIHAPSLLPALPHLPVHASAGFDPAGDG